MQTLTSSRLDMLNFVDRGIANMEANTPAIQEQMRKAFPGKRCDSICCRSTELFTTMRRYRGRDWTPTGIRRASR